MASDVNEVLQQAMEFYVAGHTVEAKALLLDLVRAHPTLEAGWMFLSYTLDDPSQKVDCLRQVIKINPQNSEARYTLESLVPSPTPATPPLNPAPGHPSPFTVDISHATDNIAELKEPIPAQGQPPKTVPAFQETPVVGGESPPTGGGSTSAAPTPVKTVAKPPATPETPQPKKRGNLGITCLVIVVIAILFVIVVGGLLWKTGVLSGFFGLNQPSGVATATPGATETPVLLTLPPQWTDTPSPTLTFTPTDTPNPTPTPTETPSPTIVPPDATQIADMVKLEKQVMNLRGLPWIGSPPVYVVSQDQAENVLQSEVDWSGYRAKIGNQAKAFVALGLIAPTFDLAKYSLTGLSEGQLGFFNPADKTIYMVGYQFGGMDHFVFTHEFDHALVVRGFPDIVRAYNDSICANDTQRCQAIQALVEGDAALLMAQWYNTYASASDKKDIGQYQIPFATGTNQNPPPYVGPLSDFTNTTGEQFVLSLWQKGNWGKVNQAYDNLPASTEQILHPDKYLKAEQPVIMTVPDLLPSLGSGWTLVESDSLGELMTYLMLAYGADTFAQIPLKDALTASAGWGGDHYLVYGSETGDQTILAAEWNWDTDKDAAEFLSSMTTYLNIRFRSGNVNQPGRDCWSLNNETTCIFHTNRNTLWVIAPSMETVNTVLSSYTAYS
jgi:hypothetical protein